MNRYTRFILAFLTAGIGALLAYLEVKSLTVSHGTSSSRLATCGLFIVPFAVSLAFPRRFWLPALTLWLSQSFTYLLCIQDPLVVMGVAFSFVIVAFSATLGFCLAYITRRSVRDASNCT